MVPQNERGLHREREGSTGSSPRVSSMWIGAAERGDGGRQRVARTALEIDLGQLGTRVGFLGTCAS
jgi:hypothetical protein